MGCTKMSDPLNALATLAAMLAFVSMAGYVLCATPKYIESKLINEMEDTPR